MLRLLAGNIWAHLLPLLSGVAVVVLGTGAPFDGPLLLSLFWPVLLCLTGSVIYHTFMANHWNYKTYITLDVSLALTLLFLHTLWHGTGSAHGID